MCVLILALAAQATAWHESFGSGWDSRWVHSEQAKYEGRFVVEAPKGFSEPALKVPEKAKHYGIATVLPEPVDPSDTLVLQYDLKVSNGLTCGGAYLKFLTADESFSASDLKDDSPYSVMFGPDKCGSTNKVHLILRHKSPKTGSIEEKHLKYPPVVESDDLTHVYTAILYPANNSYAVLIDGEEKKAGSLFDDFDPPVNPPAEIPDPDDSKPDDWIDEPKIADPAATKPEDWDEDAPEYIEDEAAEKPEGWLDDEPLEVDDPDAVKPEDWDDEEDGDWEPNRVANPLCKDGPGCGAWVRPTTRNPEYKGKWTAPLIDNPEYKGPWKARDIPNPEFYEDAAPLEHIGSVGAVAIEIWTMDDGYFFNNVAVTNSPEEAAALRASTWAPRHAVEAAAKAAADKAAAAEADKASATDKGATTLDAIKDKVAPLVGAAFESPLLKPLAAQLAPLRAALEGNPLLAVGVVALPVALLITLLLSGSKPKKVDDVGAAKKADVTGKDDAAPAKSPSKKAAAAKKEESADEIEEDEDEGDKPVGARRRARRD